MIEHIAFSMVLGDPEGPGREATHPGDATFRGFGALGGDYRGGYLTRVTIFWGQFCSRLEVQRFSTLESSESCSETELQRSRG